MKHTVIVSDYLKANVWLDEFPFDPPQPAGWIKSEYASAAADKVARRAVCLEVYISHGPRMLYGLIGGSFSENSSGKTGVRIGISPGCKEESFVPVAPVLANFDTILIGLPEDYARGAARGISETAGRLPEGELDVSHAAYAEINSSQSMFYKIAKELPLLFLQDESYFLTRDFNDLLKTLG